MRKKKSPKFYNFVVIIINTCFTYINKFLILTIILGDRSYFIYLIGEQTEAQTS